ncbi:hypothetical protein TGMAS_236270 [Toxoplasma gondii MAS]|uniref:RING-type domain-containing protein n=3 Tax=Toxoplasma gondii TaxID=5811 RepID=A0A086QUG2_TOXGO|nr:hypothetical protein TGMAS_236270 [Toxoplasma gondii MAS]
MLQTRSSSFSSSGFPASGVRNHPFQNVPGTSETQHVAPAARRGAAPSFSSFSNASPPPPPIHSAFLSQSSQFGAFPSPSSFLPGPGLRLQIQQDIRVSSLPPEKHANLFCPVCTRPSVQRCRTVPCRHLSCGSCAEEMRTAGRCSTCGAGVTDLEDLHPSDELHICRETEDCGAAFLNAASLAYHSLMVHQLPALQPLVDAVAASGDAEQTLTQLLRRLREPDERKQTVSSKQIIRPAFPASAASSPSAAPLSSLAGEAVGNPPAAPADLGQVSAVTSSPLSSAVPSSVSAGVRPPGVQSPACDSREKKTEEQGVVLAPGGLQETAARAAESRGGRDAGIASGVWTPGMGEKGRDEGRVPQQPNVSAAPAAIEEEEDEDLEGVL